ncbi:hypothetical protein [Halomonas salifodinae]|uniref:hypothetical protein n=1 Tax=Halomonas salifodinae TaxID=438745 RepID=UPI00339F0447
MEARRRLTWMGVVILTLSVAGCGGEAEETSPPEPSPDPVAAVTEPQETMPDETAVPLDAPVWVELEPAVRPDRRLSVAGETNLPEGTRLLIVVVRDASGVSWRHRTQVGEAGRFEVGPFGPGSGLAAGGYTLRLEMSPGNLQPASVQAVIGAQGEHLAGDWVREAGHGLGQVIEYRTTYELGHR